MASKDTNDEAIKALALRLGASARLTNGETFNAAGIRRATSPSAPKPQPEVKPQDDPLMAKVVAMLEKMQTPAPAPVQQVVPAPDVIVQPAQVVMPAPVSWKFTFERNDNGTIRSITATPNKT
jgi:hypothetical protein